MTIVPQKFYLKEEFEISAVKNGDVSNLSSNYEKACFFAGEELYHSIIFVITQDRLILFKYETDCYINKCAISDSGKYLIFQTANPPDTSHKDGHRLFFADVENQRILWSIETETRFQTVKHYFIDERARVIMEMHDDYRADYSFDGIFLNRDEWLNKRPHHSDASFYELVSRAASAAEAALSEGVTRSKIHYVQDILCSLEKGEVKSTYQFANVWKLLGDMYFEMRDKERSLIAYKKGLEYNPKLPVKRIIKILETS